MRKQSVCAAMALAVCIVSAGVAAAKSKSKKLSFGADFWVGSTLVKAGTYDVAYDDKSGEVTINDKSSTVARTAVSVEKREKTKAGWDVVLAQKGGGLSLVSLAFPGDKENLIVGATAGSPNSGAASATP
jgi:hypothetical protein